MIPFLRNLLFNNWQRKVISIAIASLAWMMVSYSLSTTKIITNIAVRVVNLPVGKTIEGLQPNGTLAQRLALTLCGNKTILENLSSNDFEIVLDASGKQDEWQAAISQNNLNSLNPDINLSRMVKKIAHAPFILRLAKLVSEKIPVLVSAPIGEVPRGYQLLDIWPYHLTTTVSGTEDQIKKLKAKGLKLIVNLSQISTAELDSLLSEQTITKKHELSYLVPDSWKVVYAHGISEDPIEVDDPDANFLRIDFVRNELLSINHPLPISLFFPEASISCCNPEILTLTSSESLEEFHGIYRLKPPLFATGVSSLFMDIVKDMLQIVVIASPSGDRQFLRWSVQFINPRHLEDRYVAVRLSDVTDIEMRDLEPRHREEYLRNRFRSYMNRFQLFRGNGKPLGLQFEWQENRLLVEDASDINSEK